MLFGLFEKLCRLNPFMACFALLFCIVEPWWMHCQQGGEFCTNHNLGEMHHSRGSFACIERGSFVSGGAVEFCVRFSIFTCSILSCHMIGVESFSAFSLGIMWLIDSLSHDWCWALSAFYLGIMWFLVSVASSHCPCLRGLRFCFFRIISAFSLGFWIFWEKFCSFSV